MKRHDAASYARSAVAVVALSTALSGCYYYVPYGYVPYDAVPTEATQPYPFKMPEEATSGTVSDSTASNTYVATAAPVCQRRINTPHFRRSNFPQLSLVLRSAA
ncbi:hypothetical protein J8I87_21065, partial [Paraburkholderia sp. LEh10]|nr:hypothetical protein [Paraburkholderia sp. LEh10]